MKKGYRLLSLVCLLFFMAIVSSCGCSKEYSVTFVNSDGSKQYVKVKENQSINKVPNLVELSNKYCEWDRNDFSNIKSDFVVNAICVESVKEMKLNNISRSINVLAGSKESEVNEIVKNMEVFVTYSDNTSKTLNKDEYEMNVKETTLNDSKIQKVIKISIVYRNASEVITVNVNKKDNYVSVYLDGNVAYIYQGFPKLNYVSEVPGRVEIDSNQTLSVGTLNYKWTFIPNDTYNYAIVHGDIAINAIVPSELRVNKSRIVLDYGVNEKQVRASIEDGLVVEAKNNSSYSVLDPSLYSIECDPLAMFVKDTHGVFRYIVKLNFNKSDVKAIIEVEVKKYDGYEFNLTPLELATYYMPYDKDNSYYHNEINEFARNILGYSEVGVFSIDSNQIITPGKNNYAYTFKPSNPNYASKTGIIEINVVKVTDIDLNSYVNTYENSVSVTTIINDLKQRNLNISYSDSEETVSERIVINSNASISFSSQNETFGVGKYWFEITYIKNGINMISERFNFQVISN